MAVVLLCGGAADAECKPIRRAEALAGPQRRSRHASRHADVPRPAPARSGSHLLHRALRVAIVLPLLFAFGLLVLRRSAVRAGRGVRFVRRARDGRLHGTATLAAHRASRGSPWSAWRSSSLGTALSNTLWPAVDRDARDRLRVPVRDGARRPVRARQQRGDPGVRRGGHGAGRRRGDSLARRGMAHARWCARRWSRPSCGRGTSGATCTSGSPKRVVRSPRSRARRRTGVDPAPHVAAGGASHRARARRAAARWAVARSARRRISRRCSGIIDALGQGWRFSRTMASTAATAAIATSRARSRHARRRRRRRAGLRRGPHRRGAGPRRADRGAARASRAARRRGRAGARVECAGGRRSSREFADVFPLRVLSYITLSMAVDASVMTGRTVRVEDDFVVIEATEAEGAIDTPSTC